MEVPLYNLNGCFFQRMQLWDIQCFLSSQKGTTLIEKIFFHEKVQKNFSSKQNSFPSTYNPFGCKQKVIRVAC